MFIWFIALHCLWYSIYLVIFYFQCAMTILLFCLLGHMYMYHIEHSLCNLTCARGKVHLVTCCPCWGIIMRGTRFGRKRTLDSNLATSLSWGGGLPQLRRRKASEARGNAIHSVAISHWVRTLPLFGLGLITGYPIPLRSNSVTTLLLINSTFYEQAVYWSPQSSIAQILTPS